MEYKDRKTKEIHKSLKEITLKNGTVIGVFQGNRGANPDLDIIIKYQEPGKRMRTPKHIHWVIDLLIKKENNKELTLKFIKYLRSMWDNVNTFESKEQQQKCELKETTNTKLLPFSELDKYGEYSVEFIGHLIELMIIMEKNGMKEAHVFRELMDAMVNEMDIFSIVSRATQNGR